MSKPGFSWRLLAHRVRGESVDIVSGAMRRAMERSWKASMPGVARPTREDEQVIVEPSVFDELVIDDWFHIEQMDDRVWWMRIGNSQERDKNVVVWVRIPAHGDTVVTAERE